MDGWPGRARRAPARRCSGSARRLWQIAHDPPASITIRRTSGRVEPERDHQPLSFAITRLARQRDPSARLSNVQDHHAAPPARLCPFLRGGLPAPPARRGPYRRPGVQVLNLAARRHPRGFTPDPKQPGLAQVQGHDLFGALAAPHRGVERIDGLRFVDRADSRVDDEREPRPAALALGLGQLVVARRAAEPGGKCLLQRVDDVAVEKGHPARRELLEASDVAEVGGPSQRLERTAA